MSSATPPVIPELTGLGRCPERERSRQRLALFGLVALAAIGAIAGMGFLFAGWNRDIVHWSAASQLERLGCLVDWEMTQSGGSTNVRVASIAAKAPITNDDLKPLARLMHVRILDLERCENVNDDGLKWLEPLNELEDLTLGSTSHPMSGVTDAGLVHFAGLKRLKTLGLSGTSVTDAGLEHLLVLENLEQVDLSDNRITDRGLSVLARLPRLKVLLLEGTDVSERAIRRLQHSQPAIEIHSDLDQDTVDPTGAARR